MINCPYCKKTSSPRERTHLRVLKTREKVYPIRTQEDAFGVQHLIDKGGEGVEIVKEVRICHPCFKKYAGGGR